MEKQLRNTELIAFRVTKSLKEKYDAYCFENGMGIAAALRCHMIRVTGADEDAGDTLRPKATAAAGEGEEGEGT